MRTSTLTPHDDQQIPKQWRRYPRTPVPAGQTTLTPVTLALTVGMQAVAGEATVIPGLLLVPQVTGEPLRYTGIWRLVHAASGLCVCPAVPIAYAREVAQWYARAGLDWDRPGAVIADDPAAQRVFFALTADLRDALHDRRPLVYARTSWVHWPPLWRIWRGGKPDPGGFDTYADAAALARSAGPASGAVQVRRNTSSPGWALRCAAPSCPDEHAWFCDGWDGHTRPGIGKRSEIERDARAVGWRDHDRHHWICSDCADQYH